GDGVVDSWAMLAPGGTLVCYGSLATHDVPGDPKGPIYALVGKLQAMAAEDPSRRAAVFNLWAGSRSRTRSGRRCVPTSPRSFAWRPTASCRRRSPPSCRSTRWRAPSAWPRPAAPSGRWSSRRSGRPLRPDRRPPPGHQVPGEDDGDAGREQADVHRPELRQAGAREVRDLLGAEERRRERRDPDGRIPVEG